MWYFTWILGALLACSFGIVNALWLENNDILEKEESDAPISDKRTGDRR